MSDLEDAEARREQIALFRYGLIAEFAHWPPGQRGLYARLAEKAAPSYAIPYSRRARVAVETLRDWLAAYRRGGFEALRPKVRRDQGQARALPPAVADLLCHLKDEHPAWSVRLVIEAARTTGQVARDVELAPATVHRLLARAGLMAPRPAEPSSKDHRRFAFAQPGELWMSDVMHGPAVAGADRRKRKAYLIAFLDDATRVVPAAAFALGENVTSFLPVFEQAIRRRGLPQRLYVDNGAAYRSQHLALVCAKLGVTLIHARPHQPAGKGKQERWFRTVRMQCLATLTEADTRSLGALNRKLWAWVEGEYHHTPHRGLDGETPLDRWARGAAAVHVPAPDLDLAAVFLFEARRKVHKDRTVSLDGLVYEVDAALVGETVTLRYDPARPGAPVAVWHQGRSVELARRVDAYAHCFVRRAHPRRPDVAPPPAGLRLRDLARGAPDADEEEGDR
jgi:transposase InsO family protein